MDNRDSFIYKTTDFGKSWKPVSGNLPKHPLSYVRTIAEDPNCQGLLFAGTGNGFYYSLDDGGHWTALDTGLPHAPVTWAVVQKGFHDLVISTYERGLYILDDITPLEQLAKSHSDTAEHYRKNDVGLLFCNRRMRPYSDNKLREKMMRPLLLSLNMIRRARFSMPSATRRGASCLSLAHQSSTSRNS